ncbi:MAG: GNAT family N-acetyltransferase [Rickettsiaceae bacterium]|nr:GNAT family N-acetyltransferase [Rickettsiaceae bacterium]
MNIQYFFGDFPALDLGYIVLREIKEADARDYFEYMNNRAMEGFLTKENRPSGINEAMEEVKYWKSLFPQKRSIYWAIALKENDKMIGTAGFNLISFPNARAEISYDLNPEYWGRGIMLTSINAILKFADIALELVRIQATVIIDNERSIKLLERAGFKKEGLLEKYEVVEGQHKDYYMYGRVVE